MGYLHIDNLYKNQNILMFKECYCMEKVHGTSAHVRFKCTVWPSEGNAGAWELNLFPGGEKLASFLDIFAPQSDITNKFLALGHDDVCVYGEAYGGKCQGMKETYGPDLKFIVFDVKIGDTWLDIPDAADVTAKLGLEFVPWKRISTDLAVLDTERDAPSEVASRRGMGNDKIREGVVLRPLTEMTDKRGNRIIVKHKGDKFSERATPQKVVSLDKIEVLKEAMAIADEWVTPMRLQHVIQRLRAMDDTFTEEISNTSKVIKAMIEDVLREAQGEIIESPDAMKAISRKAAEIWKKKIATIVEK
jgi:hypothetical protein